jgi:uncharacterized membrane protein YphA (DoxX/SURF4 family)
METLRYKSALDVTARIMGVGIFVLENYNHMMNFNTEVSALVHPAIHPLPRWVAEALHVSTITLGLAGSVSV